MIGNGPVGVKQLLVNLIRVGYTVQDKCTSVLVSFSPMHIIVFLLLATRRRQSLQPSENILHGIQTCICNMQFVLRKHTFKVNIPYLNVYLKMDASALFHSSLPPPSL